MSGRSHGSMWRDGSILGEKGTRERSCVKFFFFFSSHLPTVYCWQNKGIYHYIIHCPDACVRWDQREFDDRSLLQDSGRFSVARSAFVSCIPVCPGRTRHSRDSGISELRAVFRGRVESAQVRPVRWRCACGGSQVVAEEPRPGDRRGLGGTGESCASGSEEGAML